MTRPKHTSRRRRAGWLWSRVLCLWHDPMWMYCPDPDVMRRLPW